MLRKYLGALMAAMGVLQLAGWSVFIDAVESYGLAGGRSAAMAIGVAIIACEILAAVGLFTDRRAGAILALTVSVAWTILGVQAFARGLTLENCGCFGRLWRQELRWWVLVEDAYLIAASIWALQRYRRGSSEELTVDPHRYPSPQEFTQ